MGKFIQLRHFFLKINPPVTNECVALLQYAIPLVVFTSASPPACMTLIPDIPSAAFCFLGEHLEGFCVSHKKKINKKILFLKSPHSCGGIIYTGPSERINTAA